MEQTTEPCFAFQRTQYGKNMRRIQMSLLNRLFTRRPEKKEERKIACIQCGGILPHHLGWCPNVAQQKPSRHTE